MLHCDKSILRRNNPLPTLTGRLCSAILRTRMFPLLLANFLSHMVPRHGRRRIGGSSRGSRTRGKPVNLALQGGGAHGAFTWGVLDQLLADGRIRIDGISGTSAGALNAVVLVDGLIRGGADEARARLADFWRAVSVDGHLPDLQRAVVERFVDFEVLRRDTGRAIFVSATDVRTGEPRIFTREEITPEVIMASAALPLLFRAVQIDGVPYWDGGYSGNPALVPFLRATETEDVLVVQINPRERREVPTRAREIMSRISEINFNAPLLSELRGIAFVNRLIDEGRLSPGTGPGAFRCLKLHRIVMDELGERSGARGTLARDYEHFEALRKLGQRATRRFLDAHFDDIGRRSTIDISAHAEAELAEL